MSRTYYLPAVGRVLLALMFVISGIGKLAAPDATQGFIASVGLPVPMISYLLAILIEVGGGLLLILGYQTRSASFALAAFTLVTALVFHSDFADQNQMIHFLKNISITGGLLQVAAFGAGNWSLDNRRLNRP